MILIAVVDTFYRYTTVERCSLARLPCILLLATTRAADSGWQRICSKDETGETVSDPSQKLGSRDPSKEVKHASSTGAAVPRWMMKHLEIC
jgi:hypothetical protein